MPDHPGLELRQIHDRTMVQLRVRPRDAEFAGTALGLPGRALECREGDPAAAWLGPDQWLLISDSTTPAEIGAHVKQALADKVHAATDMSSAYACYALRGPAARTVLAMGCGIDMHPGAFAAGQCVRTRFADVPLLIVATEEHGFDLYIDRSLARYLNGWIEVASEEPITRDGHLSDSKDQDEVTS